MNSNLVFVIKIHKEQSGRLTLNYEDRIHNEENAIGVVAYLLFLMNRIFNNMGINIIEPYREEFDPGELDRKTEGEK